ncbi:DUF4270 family protein [Sphingobacterium sp. LRF_L2]|uniref:DUF4270 family protein n=1 Tax=Sphingobacterium sp. LRF_L2 TaxID=3369421 RepID=UPI003F5DEADF
MTNLTIRKHLLKILGALLLMPLFYQCADIESVSLDLDSSSLGVNSSDTFAVKTSTFLLDPLPTGGRGLLLVGAYEDSYVGQAKISSYFRLEQPDVSKEFTNDVQFDSLTISLFYNGYYYGDTTKNMTLNVHRLTEDIDPRELSIALEDDEYPVFVSSETLYADQTFAYQSTALGSKSFLPRPKSISDTIRIKLSQDLGNELFQMIRNKDSKLTIEDEYLEFFKGLALVPGDDAQAVIGLKDSVAFNLHYSYERQSDGRQISDSLTINIGSSSYQYNKVDADRTSSTLADLSYSNQEIDPSNTNQRTFIQGATGITTRIRFPELRQTLGLGETSINKAQLIIETDQPELGYTPPPDSLIIMVANKYGTPTSVLQNSSGSSIIATYRMASSWGGIGRGKYVFDITDYIRELIKTTSYNEEETLLISLPTSKLMSSVNMLRIAQEDDKPAIKLNVLYIKTQ